MNKICCLFNYNPSYRFPIYYEMSKTFDCDFYFGDNVFEKLKQFDADKLPGFKSYLKAKRIGNSFIWYSGVRRLLNKEYKSYVLTGSPGLLANWLIILYAKLTGKKIFCWCHGPKSHRKDLMTMLITKPFFKSMDGVLLYNNYNKQFLLPLGIKEDKIHIIHNSLNTSVQTRLFNELKTSSIYINHFQNTNPVAIFIGRIQKRMKVHYLVEAMDYLKREGININVVFVGPFMDGENIEQLVKGKGLESQTWFFGASYEEETTSELLYNADVCVAPGTVGLTAIHSLSYGTPVVTHNNFSHIGPEFESIQDGVTGSFFEEDNIESLANAIKKWIGLPKTQRDLVRLHARKEIEQSWSIAYQIRILKDIIR